MAKPRMIGTPSKPIQNKWFKPKPFGKRRKKK